MRLSKRVLLWDPTPPAPLLRSSHAAPVPAVRTALSSPLLRLPTGTARIVMAAGTAEVVKVQIRGSLLATSLSGQDGHCRRHPGFARRGKIGLSLDICVDRRPVCCLGGRPCDRDTKFAAQTRRRQTRILDPSRSLKARAPYFARPRTC